MDLAAMVDWRGDVSLGGVAWVWVWVWVLVGSADWKCWVRLTMSAA